MKFMVKKQSKTFFIYLKFFNILKKKLNKHKIYKIRRLQPFTPFRHLLLKPNYYFLGIYWKRTFFMWKIRNLILYRIKKRKFKKKNEKKNYVFINNKSLFLNNNNKFLKLPYLLSLFDLFRNSHFCSQIKLYYYLNAYWELIFSYLTLSKQVNITKFFSSFNEIQFLKKSFLKKKKIIIKNIFYKKNSILFSNQFNNVRLRRWRYLKLNTIMVFKSNNLIKHDTLLRKVFLFKKFFLFKKYVINLKCVQNIKLNNSKAYKLIPYLWSLKFSKNSNKLKNNLKYNYKYKYYYHKYFLEYTSNGFNNNSFLPIGLPYISNSYDLLKPKIHKLSLFISNSVDSNEDISGLKYQLLKHFLFTRVSNKKTNSFYPSKLKKKWKKKKFFRKIIKSRLDLYYKLNKNLLNKNLLNKNLPFQFIYIFFLRNLYINKNKFLLKSKYSFKSYKYKYWRKWKYNNNMRLYKIRNKYTDFDNVFIYRRNKFSSYLRNKKKWKNFRVKKFNKRNFKRKIIFMKKNLKLAKSYINFRFFLWFKKYSNTRLFFNSNFISTNLLVLKRTRKKLKKKIRLHILKKRIPEYLNTNRYKNLLPLRTNRYAKVFFYNKWDRKRWRFYVSKKMSIIYKLIFLNENLTSKKSPRHTLLTHKPFRVFKLLRSQLIFNKKLYFFKNTIFYTNLSNNLTNSKQFQLMNFPNTYIYKKNIIKQKIFHKKSFILNTQNWIFKKLHLKILPTNTLHKYINLNTSSFLIYKAFKLSYTRLKQKLVKWYTIYDFVYPNELRRKLFNRKKRSFMFNLVHKHLKNFKKKIFYKKWFNLKKFRLKIIKYFYQEILSSKYILQNNIYSKLFLTNNLKYSTVGKLSNLRYTKNIYYLNEAYTKNKYYNYERWKEAYLKRIRFRPGYQRLWRRARLGLAEFMGWRFIYQQQITNKVKAFQKLTQSTRLWLKNATFKQMFLYTRLLPSEDSFNLFFTQNKLFLNSAIPIRDDIICFKNDLIQVLINYSYYVYYKWLKNWTQIRNSKFRQLVYRKGKAYKYKVIKQRKQKSYYIPKWIYIVKYDFIDVKSFLEVDYFTLSAFIIYPLYYYYFLYFEHFDYLRARMTRIYNWKYIN
uniref:Ribosomal protein S4 n=1 Tax=Strombidium sp. TaxID=181122 RepID=A0A7T0Q589_9SPIT|nr:ribosomal protein S4 [Strombidium sp.]